MNLLGKLILLLTFCSLASPFYSQADSRSKNIQTINGKKYYIHKVEKGQSIYAISKIYATDLNSIFTENPDAIDGIEAGQELKIPFAKEKDPVSTAQAMSDMDKYLLHKVSKGETVFGICKKYKLTEARLSDLNPEIKQGLKEGMQLKVALKETGKENRKEDYKMVDSTTPATPNKKPDEVKTETVENIQPQEFTEKQKKQNYRVGVFLPLNLPEAEQINPDQLALDKLPFPITQQICIDFYAGMLTALDTVLSNNFKVTYEIYDVDDRDSMKLDKLCSEERFKTLDLIIGPLYISAFKVVSAYALKNQIPIVSPVAQQNKILFNAPFCSKTTPSNNTLIEGLAEFVADSFRKANVIIINTGKAKEQGNLKTFKRRYNEYLASKYNNSKDTLPEVKGLAGAKNAYNAGKKNYFVLLSEDEVFLTDFLTQLHVFADKKDISLIGVKKWVNSDNLDPEYLNHFSFIHAAPVYIDYNQEDVKRITVKYRDKYYTDPSEFYYEGYDVAFFYLNALKNNGPMFYSRLDTISGRGTVMDFHFFRPSHTTGYDNKSIQIIRYLDYKFRKIN